MTEAEARTLIIDALLKSKVLNARRHGELGNEPATDVDLAALGIDSMAVIDLCVALEEVLHRDVEIEELIENPSLNQLARHVAAGSGNSLLEPTSG